MSRYYEMTVEITGYKAGKTQDIKDAFAGEWVLEDQWGGTGGNLSLHLSGRGNLCGGESEEEFTDRLAIAIWKANGKYCEVVVNAIYLEEFPYKTHLRSEGDYDELMRKKVKTST